jgi:starvation-inducible DNA-binding protein
MCFSRVETGVISTRNDLDKSVRRRIVQLLNPILGNLIDLGLRSKQAHWNLRGPNFMSLHLLLDEVAEKVEEGVDTVAERIVQLGGIAEGTLQAVTAATRLPEYCRETTDWMDSLTQIADSLGQVGKMVRQGIDQADGDGDADTADILTGLSRDLDKYLWFVEAHLQKSSE